MRVFIVEECEYSDGCEILGVYFALGSAMTKAEEMMKCSKYSYDHYRITGWNVNKKMFSEYIRGKNDNNWTEKTVEG